MNDFLGIGSLAQARPFHVAAKWADILQEEFASQGDIERDLEIPTTLFGGPPELGNINKLANSQNGFMKIFAHPLFKSVSEVIPSMAFAVYEMDSNRETWQKKMEHQNSQQDEKAKKQSLRPDDKSPDRSGNSSYSSSQPELSHPEGFPASGSSLKNTLFLGSTTLQDSNETRRASAGSIHSEVLGPTQHSQSQVSRRSSAGHPYAFSNAVSRQSSNTSPTQIQLGPSTDPTLQRHASGGNWENVPPQRQGSTDTLSHSNVSAVASETGSRNMSASGGGGSTTHRGSKGSKSSEGDSHFQSHQRSMLYSINPPSIRHPQHSVHERHSSGGHTSRSQSVPYSPAETQATSITDDSDGRDSHVREQGETSIVSQGLPNIVNVEKPGSSHRFTGPATTDSPKGVDVKTAVVNGTAGGIHTNSGRLVNRKSSKFLNFWKKGRKAAEANP